MDGIIAWSWSIFFDLEWVSLPESSKRAKYIVLGAIVKMDLMAPASANNINYSYAATPVVLVHPANHFLAYGLRCFEMSHYSIPH